jgi:hypothetical protein
MLDIGALALRLEAVGGADVVRDLRGVDAAAEKTGQKLDTTAKKSTGLGAAMKGLRSEVAFLAAGLASAALAATLQASFEAADAFESALRRLQGTARLTGTPMLQLHGMVDQARQQFKLATPEAAGFASEIAKLGAKAGDLSKSGTALRSILDLGAARGMDPATTMERLRAAINGSDEAIEKFFAKNPSALWAEYARSIGTTAGKLTDQQKATALLDAFLKDGAKVRGEYGERRGEGRRCSNGGRRTRGLLRAQPLGPPWPREQCEDVRLHRAARVARGVPDGIARDRVVLPEAPPLGAPRVRRVRARDCDRTG